jgi:hypothetical protein
MEIYGNQDSNPLLRRAGEILNRLTAGRWVTLSFLGIGMLLLDHGGTPGLFASAEISEVTDHIAVTVVAAIWLVHIVISTEARRINSEEASAPPPSSATAD